VQAPSPAADRIVTSPLMNDRAVIDFGSGLVEQSF
jgi:hypothetical protein